MSHVTCHCLYESGQADDGTPYIAMEYLEGESLRQALARRGAPVDRKVKGHEPAGSGASAAELLALVELFLNSAACILGNRRRAPKFQTDSSLCKPAREKGIIQYGSTATLPHH